MANILTPIHLDNGDSIYFSDSFELSGTETLTDVHVPNDKSDVYYTFRDLMF